MKIAVALIFALLLAFVWWHQFVALDEVPMQQREILQAYDYWQVENAAITLTEIDPGTFTFVYDSFDGAPVNGQISYPVQKSENYPVLIGISAMGRSYVRWWTDSFKDRPTVTQVNKIAELANRKGYVVVAIDARYHGERKDPERTLRSIMNDLHFFGDKKDYEAMIRDTVLDHRVLLDWISQQDNLDKDNIKVAGYSMGGQISLILASIDDRVTEVISIVPPYVDDKVALVAPKNFVSLLGKKPVLLITADNDENASAKENDFLYDLIPGSNKARIDFDGDHILPEGYTASLADRL